MTTLGSKGRPDLKEAARLYREAKADEAQPGLLAPAVAMSRMAKQVEKAAEGKGTKVSFGSKNRQLQRIRYQSRVRSFGTKRSHLSQVALAEAILLEHPPQDLDAAVHFAKTWNRQVQKEEKARREEAVKVLSDHAKNIGAAEVARYKEALPILKSFTCSLVPCADLPVLEIDPISSQREATQLCGALSSQHVTVANHMERWWTDLHATIQEEPERETAQIPKPPSSQCRDAGVCVCQGRGKDLARLKVAFLQSMKSTFHTPGQKDMLGQGALVAHLLPSTQQSHPLHCGSDSYLLQVALMYWSPYRPTLQRLDVAQDSSSCLLLRVWS